MSRYRAFSLVYQVQVLWHGLDDTTIMESFGLTHLLGQKSQNTLGRCMRYLWSKN